MLTRRRSAVAWRFGVVVLAVMAAVQLAIDAFQAPRVLQAGGWTAPLFEGAIVREPGPTTFVVRSVPPGSPLAAAGVVPGDRIRYDTPLGRWYNVPVGAPTAVTVLQGSTSRRVEIAAMPAGEPPRFQMANTVIDAAARVAALVIGVVIGWRRADLMAFRALAAGGLLYALSFPYSAPAGAHLEWLDFASSVAAELVTAALVFFAVNYPDDRPRGARAVLKRAYPRIFAALVAIAVYYYARLYAGFQAPWAAAILRACPIVLPAVFFWATAMAWRQSRGESRLRLQWIMATLGTIMGVTLLGTLNHVAGHPVPQERFELFLNAAGLVAEIGFVYAVLHRRIFDFGVAVNRTLVFAIVGAILLGVFQVAHAVIGEYLHFQDRSRTILLSAVLAVTVYLSFQQLKHRVEKLVERVLFSSWAAREADLRDCVDQARHASDAEALEDLWVAAIDRFAQGTGCVVLRVRAEGGYARGAGTLAGAPARVDDNDELALAMQAKDEAYALRDPARYGGAALALPMQVRGRLQGFVLVGPRRDGDAYRPDQVEALEAAARELALEFQRLRMEALEAELAAERHAAALARAQRDTALALARDASGRAALPQALGGT